MHVPVTKSVEILLRSRHPWRHTRRLVDRAAQANVPAWALAARFGSSLVRERVARLRTPTVQIDKNGTKVFADLGEPLGLWLYRYGLRAPEARLIEELLGPGDVFIDGGAHVGVFTLVAAAAVGPNGRVIACEPVPGTMELLRANVALNGFDWVDARAVALADAPGESELYSFGSGSGLSSFAPASVLGSEVLRVQVMSLDAIAASHSQPVRMVKLDLEGAEVLALRGARELLRQRPHFVVEVEPEHLERQGTTVAEMRAIFHGAGYCAYQIHGDRESVVLVPTETWEPGCDNPNIFVSTASPSELPPALRVASVVPGTHEGSLLARS